MKNVFLTRLVLKNFKGVEHVDFSFTTNSSSIYGNNGTGKSTLLEAYLWLITDKNSEGKKEPYVKNTKKTELNKLHHVVLAYHDVIDTTTGSRSEVVLEKRYLEKWTKKQGSLNTTFDGHTTEYLFNIVPLSATEYQKRIDEIVAPNLIKLLINPYYFNSLEWEAKRRALFIFSGGVSNINVVNRLLETDEDGYEYTELIKVINSASSILEQDKKIDDLKASTDAKKTKMVKEAKDYPVKIEEAVANKPQEKDWDLIKNKISDKKNQIKEIGFQLSDSYSALTFKQQKVNEIQKQIYGEQAVLDKELKKIDEEVKGLDSVRRKSISDVEASVFAIKDEITKANNKLSTNNAEIAKVNDKIAKLEADKKVLLEQYYIIKNETFDLQSIEVGDCPACKRPLDRLEPDQEIARLNDMETQFNAAKESKISENKNKGIALASEIDRLNYSKSSIETEFYEKRITQYRSELAVVEKNLSISKQEYQNNVFDAKLETEIRINRSIIIPPIKERLIVFEAEKEKELAILNLSTGEESKKIEAELKQSEQKLQNEIDELNKELGVKDMIKLSEERIHKLNMEMDAANQEICDLEKIQFEITLFTRKKMDEIEAKVNKLFKIVKFRLFDIQVNGAVKEDCICLINDVPYQTANTASQIVAGLDIIDTLCAHYKITMPIFIDNRESVFKIQNIQSQIINLIASEIDFKLRLENA